MDTSLIIILAIFSLLFIAANAFILWVLQDRSKKPDTSLQNLVLIQQQIQELTRTVDDRLMESSYQVHRSVQAQLSESSKLIREVTAGLTKLDDTNKQVIGFADQLQSLQDVLKNPKQRGVLGEYYLETVLSNVLAPGQFQMQYKFADGEIVDAVVFLDGKYVPIDSKFSLENYNRILVCRDVVERESCEKAFRNDIKNRIDETAKYVRPNEGTMEFAFMFVPSEAIYYDLLINQVGTLKSSSRDLIEYAFHEKKVIIVSPTSFLAYLQTVLQGLRALKIEESAKEIRKNVEQLGRHIGNYHEFMAKLGNSLSTTVNCYNTAHKELKKIDKDVYKITGESTGVESLLLDKPEKEELV